MNTQCDHKTSVCFFKRPSCCDSILKELLFVWPILYVERVQSILKGIKIQHDATEVGFWKFHRNMCNCHPEKDDCAKVGNCLQKNISWLVTAGKCYQRAKEDKVCASGHGQDSANVHLQTRSHISANSQTVWAADEINSIGSISCFSHLLFKILSAAPQVAFILELLTEKMIRPSPAVCAPSKCHRKCPQSQTTAPSGAHMTDRVWPQVFPKQSGEWGGNFLQLTQKHRIPLRAFKCWISFFALACSDVFIKSSLIWPASRSTLCHITVGLLAVSSQRSSSQGTFLGEQTELIDLSLARWQTWASCQEPPPLPPPLCLSGLL